MSYKDKLVSDINSLIKDFKELNTYKKSEEHIQSLFILKLLELLGWNSKTIIVNTGQEIKTGKRPDIILNKDGNTLLVIESKDASRYDMLDGFYQKDKSKISFVEQLCNYCDAEGIYWGILTNFVEWRLYSVFQKRLYKNEYPKLKKINNVKKMYRNKRHIIKDNSYKTEYSYFKRNRL